MSRVARRRLWRALVVAGALLVSVVLANLWVASKARPFLLGQRDDATREVIVVLGAAVRGEVPSPVLARRLALAARLFHDGRAERVLVSGKREPPYYDETRAMRRYLLDEGVPAERIVEDPLGYRTYETFRRARDEYGVRGCLIVTNAFHIERSVYLARALGIDALGVAADDSGFSRSTRMKWAAREALARARAVLDVVLAPRARP